MSTMNISLPETLRSFVDQQVTGRGFGTSSEYVREPIRKDQDRQNLRRLLLNGAATAPTDAADDQYFASLRDRASLRAAMIRADGRVPHDGFQGWCCNSSE